MVDYLIDVLLLSVLLCCSFMLVIVYGQFGVSVLHIAILGNIQCKFAGAVMFLLGMS